MKLIRIASALLLGAFAAIVVGYVIEYLKGK